MTLRLGGDGAITGCTSLENPDLTVSGLTISGSFDAEKVLVASGTAAAPSYTFSGDTDNGLYYAGTNSIGVSTAGTSAIVVDSSQRVGIGAASIDRHFHVEGTANVQGKFQNNASLCLIEFEDVNTTAGNRPSFGSVGNEAVIHAAGSERMRIDSSGRLLVGKTNATSGARLQIQGISTNPASYGYMSIHRGSIPSSANDDLGYITFEDSSSNQGAYIQARRDGGTWTSGSSHPTYLAFWTTANGASSPTERMRIDSSGRIGIGTTSPGVILDVAGSNPTLRVRATTVNTEVSTLRLTEDNSYVGAYVKYDGSTNLTHIGTHSAADSNTANDNHAITIVRDTRNVGIGTTSPRGLLHVGPDLASGATDAARINLKQAAQTPADGIYLERPGERRGYSMYMGGPNDGLTFRANNVGTFTTTMYLDREGIVSIGTTNTSAKLSVWENAAVNEPVRINDTNNTNGHTHRISFRTGDVEAGKITSNRTSTNYVTSSDYRLKENVVDIAEGITRVKQLAPKRFNFIADADTTVDGFLAHEAQTVVPEAVTGTHNEVDDEGNPVYQGIDHSKLVPLLTAALKEALAEIESLKARVTALEP